MFNTLYSSSLVFYFQRNKTLINTSIGIIKHMGLYKIIINLEIQYILLNTNQTNGIAEVKMTY